jgi:hypothetical protein
MESLARLRANGEENFAMSISPVSGISSYPISPVRVVRPEGVSAAAASPDADGDGDGK